MSCSGGRFQVNIYWTPTWKHYNKQKVSLPDNDSLCITWARECLYSDNKSLAGHVKQVTVKARGPQYFQYDDCWFLQLRLSLFFFPGVPGCAYSTCTPDQLYLYLFVQVKPRCGMCGKWEAPYIVLHLGYSTCSCTSAVGMHFCFLSARYLFSPFILFGFFFLICWYQSRLHKVIQAVTQSQPTLTWKSRKRLYITACVIGYICGANTQHP